MKKWFLVSYDVHDPKRLRQVAKKIKGFGTRIQFSVFRCQLSQSDIEKLQWELSKVMSADDDLLIIEICHGCALKIKDTSHKWENTPATFDVF